MDRNRIALFALLLLFAGHSVAFADCDRPRSALLSLDRADLVFRGTVRQVRELRKDFPVTARYSETRTWARIVMFDVDRVWKGNVGKRMTLHVAQLSEDDAFEWFRQGEAYVVFAHVNPPEKSVRFENTSPTYGATLCGGTGPIRTSSDYVRELGAGRPPK